MKEKRLTSLIANVVIVAVLALLCTATLYVGSTTATFAENRAIYRGNANQKVITFMFNVYGGSEYIDGIMDCFNERASSTTFFLGGKWVESNGELVKKMHEQGFELGNHGYLHRDHSTLSVESNKQEIIFARNIISRSIGTTPSSLFAPPSGAIGNNMFTACAQLNMPVIMWSRDTIDWRDHNTEIIYSRAVKDISNGDLVLMHPTENTLEALPRVLDYAISCGFRIVTVSENIGQGAA